MKKYLELFKEGFPSDMSDRTAIENWPYVGHDVPSGEVVYTEITLKYIIGTVDGSVAVENLTENDALWYGNKGFRGDITLLKEFTSTGGWNTITLPFTLYTLEGTPFEGSTVYKIIGFKSSTFELEEVTVSKSTPMLAGYPYIIEVPSDIVNPTFINVKLEVMNNAECALIQIDEFTFKGIVLQEPLDLSNYRIYGIGPNNRVVELYGADSISGLKLIFMSSK